MVEDVTCCTTGALTTAQPYVHLRIVCSELTYVPESRCLVVDGPRNATVGAVLPLYLAPPVYHAEHGR